MRQAIKYLAAKTYKPLLENYLSRPRGFAFQNIRLVIPPEVFHPGFFYSTKLLLRCLSRLQLAHKTFLELGAGSGLLSIYAAQKGACVTASDINPFAIATIPFSIVCFCSSMTRKKYLVAWVVKRRRLLSSPMR